MAYGDTGLIGQSTDPNSLMNQQYLLNIVQSLSAKGNPNDQASQLGHPQSQVQEQMPQGGQQQQPKGGGQGGGSPFGAAASIIKSLAPKLKQMGQQQMNAQQVGQDAQDAYSAGGPDDQTQTGTQDQTQEGSTNNNMTPEDIGVTPDYANMAMPASDMSFSDFSGGGFGGD